jgi:serine/threonine protein kinase
LALPGLGILSIPKDPRFPEPSEQAPSVVVDISLCSAIDTTIDLPCGKMAQNALRNSSNAVSVGRIAVGQEFGDYDLIEEIARGGMGIVFKARQVQLNRIVALKMILAGEMAGIEDVQRFKNEAEAAANLDHPGIVPIYEIGTHNAQHYFSMAFIDGSSLADQIKNGPLPEKDAAGILKKVAEAVAYAHGKGVIHRDLKPANVLIDAHGEPRVTDFGLAKQTRSDGDLTHTGAVIGTPSYMPPEQAAGKTDRVDTRADVYSLGAILYCLLTGRPPFLAATSLEILRQVLEQDAVSPLALVSGLSKDLETICLKCWEKDPNRRYQTAQQLADELQRFLQGEPILARPISRVTRARRWCQRNPVIASASLIALGCVVVTLVGLAIAFRLEANSRRRAERALSTVRLQGIADIVSSKPDEAQLQLEKIPPEHRDLTWQFLNRSAESFHRQIRVDYPDTPTGQRSSPFSWMWLSPRGRNLLYCDLDTFWLLSCESGAKPKKILDYRHYKEIVKTQLGEEYLDSFRTIPLGPRFESEQAFTLHDSRRPKSFLRYTLIDDKWSAKRILADSEVPGGEAGVKHAADPALGDLLEVDGEPLRLILSASLADGRIVECRASDKAITRSKWKDKDGKESRHFVSSKGPHTICVRPATAGKEGDQSQLLSFAMPSLTNLDAHARMTVCRDRNRVLLQNRKSVVVVDLDENYVRELNSVAKGTVWRAAISKDGNRVAFIHHLRQREDIKRVAITIVDSSGEVLFTSWFRSSLIESTAAFDPNKQFQVNKFSFFMTDGDLANSHFSADGKSFVVIADEHKRGLAIVHVLTLDQEGVGPTWQAHDKPIIAAAAIPAVNEITTVDQTGLVRNWKERTLLSEWRIPGIDGVASVCVRGNTLMCLNWERAPQTAGLRPFAASDWAERRAVFDAGVFDRHSGKELLTLPKVTILDNKSGIPKRAFELSTRDLTLLPVLSSDGRYVVQATQADGKHRIKCVHVQSAATVLEHEIPDLLRVGFDQKGDCVLALSQVGSSKFSLRVFDVAKASTASMVSLSVPPKGEQEQAKIEAWKEQFPAGLGDPFPYEQVWPAFALFAFRSAQGNSDWEPFFNQTGRVNLADLQGIPLIVNLADGKYLDFRHRTNEIRLRARDTKVLHEIPMTLPLKELWATVADKDRALLTIGRDQVLQIRDLPSGDLVGSLPLPFKRLDGLSESRDNGSIIIWGDQGRIAVYDTTRH